VVALRGVDDDGAGLGEGIVQRAVEALGEGFERGGFDADEMGGGFGLGRSAHGSGLNASRGEGDGVGASGGPTSGAKSAPKMGHPIQSVTLSVVVVKQKG
jgi:hypothetical protein